MPNSADHLLLPVLLSREEVVVLLGPLVETWLKRRSEAGVEIEWRGERSGWNRRKKKMSFKDYLPQKFVLWHQTLEK